MALNPRKLLVHQLPKIEAQGTPIHVGPLGTMILVYRNEQWWIACRDALSHYGTPRHPKLPECFRNYAYLRIRIGHGRERVRTRTYMRLSDALDGLRHARAYIKIRRVQAICAAIAEYMMPELADVNTPSAAPEPHVPAPTPAAEPEAPEPAAAPQPIAKIKARIASVHLARRIASHQCRRRARSSG